MKRFAAIPLILLAMVFMFFISCEISFEPDDPIDPVDPDPYSPFNPDLDYGEITDLRDGQKYRTIDIGAQSWMAENLNHTTGNSWCSGDDPANCQTYGRLYDWDTALTACDGFTGWKLPSRDDWEDLITFLGGEDVAGGKMKSTGTLFEETGLWSSPNTGATNSSGWSGLPGGYRLINGSWSGLKSTGVWWSSSELGGPIAPERIVYFGLGRDTAACTSNPDNKGLGLSVRCIKD